MRTRIFFLLLLVTVLWQTGYPQKNLNVGIGYYGEAISDPGLLLEFEVEKFHGETLSMPFRMDLGYFVRAGYQALFFDIHKGFRKRFSFGLLLEQSVGLGIISTFYDVESIYYFDQYGNSIRYYDGANLGFMPSVSLGLGYDLTKGKAIQNLIWLRPKIYWNLGFRGLAYPYSALQVGFTRTLKSR